MSIYKFLKRFRVVISLLVLMAITYFFMAIRVQGEQYLSLLLKIQFVPAFLSAFAASFVALTLLLLLTLLLGRVYCSLLCPMGAFQDVVIRLSNFFKTKKQKRFHYAKETRWLRYSLLALAMVAAIAGFTLPLLLLDPYSNFGRMASHLFQPVAYAVNNGLHYLLPNTVYYQSYIAGTALGFLLPIAIFLTVVGMSALKGRLFCNTICPVGSFLGLISKFAACKLTVDKEACNHCGLCELSCKAQCISSKLQLVDHSRCVGCLNCTLACKQNAMKYSFSWSKKRCKMPATAPASALARRTFLASAGAMAGAAAIYRIAGGKPLTSASPGTTIAPPGARSHAHLKEFCTACQACVAACPTHIIKPTFTGYGTDGWMLPEITFNRGFCSYDCNRCTQVCPSMALERIPLEEKKLTQIGKAHFIGRHCVVLREGTDCGACDEHCPTKAVHMVPFGNKGLRRPVIDVEQCIGCGACEYICPTSPKAITVQAQAIHTTATPPSINQQEQVQVSDFGF